MGSGYRDVPLRPPSGRPRQLPAFIILASALGAFLAALAVASNGHTPQGTGAGGRAIPSASCRQPSIAAPFSIGIKIGSSPKHCVTASAEHRLGKEALPFLGVSCSVPNSIACDRVGIGVWLDHRATAVIVRVAGRRVALRPQTDLRPTLWQGYLNHARLRHGPLNVHLPLGKDLWYGTPAVRPRVRLSVLLANDTTVTLTTTDFLHAGFG